MPFYKKAYLQINHEMISDRATFKLSSEDTNVPLPYDEDMKHGAIIRAVSAN